MQRLTGSRILASTWLAGACLLGTTAHAQSTPRSDPAAAEAHASPEAEELFRHARELHRQKRWQEAREAYDHAWQLERTFQVAANLALVELRLGRARDAAEHLSFALAHLPASDPKVAEARVHLEEMLKQATSQVGTLKLDVDHDKAIIYVDDQPVGASPLEHPIYLDAGRHVVNVKSSASPPVTRELSIEPGVVYRLELTSGASAPPVAPGDVPPPPARVAAAPPRDRGRGLDTRIVVVAGEAALALAAAGFGTAFALQASSGRNRADQLRAFINASGDPTRVEQGTMCDSTYAARPPECAQLSKAVDDTDAAAARSTIAFIAAAGFASASVATYFLWPASGPGREHARAGVRLGGTFTDKIQMVGVTGAF